MSYSDTAEGLKRLATAIERNMVPETTCRIYYGKAAVVNGAADGLDPQLSRQPNGRHAISVVLYFAPGEDELHLHAMKLLTGR